MAKENNWVYDSEDEGMSWHETLCCAFEDNIVVYVIRITEKAGDEMDGFAIELYSEGGDNFDHMSTETYKTLHETYHRLISLGYDITVDQIAHLL